MIRAAIEVQRNPTVWPADTLGLEVLQRFRRGASLDDGSLVLVSAAEAAVLLEESGGTLALQQHFASRTKEYKSAAIILFLMSDRQKGMAESTASHFHGGIMDMRNGAQVLAFHADSAKNSKATAKIARDIFRAIMCLVEREEDELVQQAYLVPVQDDSWSCMWRTCMALEQGTHGLLEKGKVPSFFDMCEVIKPEAVCAYRDQSVGKILQVSLLLSFILRVSRLCAACSCGDAHGVFGVDSIAGLHESGPRCGPTALPPQGQRIAISAGQEGADGSEGAFAAVHI